MIIPNDAKTEEESLKRLENFELTPEKFRYLLNNQIREIKFNQVIPMKAALTTKNEILLRKEVKSLEEITLSLVHECIHLASGVFPTMSFDYNELEHRIEEITRTNFERYRETYLDIVNDLLMDMVTQGKLETSYFSR